MKIIIRDNFGRDEVSDRLVCENVTEIMGKHIVKLLNKAEPENSPSYFALVPDNYELHKFEP
jgi:hypothetical protein